MEQEKQIQDLNQRLTSVESQLKKKSLASKFLKFLFGILISFVILLILIGLFLVSW